MVILFKISKLDQLQMVVESREPIKHSDFFRLKHTYIIAEQKKSLYGRFLLGAILSKNSQVTMAKWFPD
jgi:hypothetical protein